MKKLTFTIALLIAGFVTYAGCDETYIYPNPAQDHVYVQIPDNLTGITVLSVLDLSGREIYRAERNFDTYDFRQTQIPVSGLPNGSYILRITNNGQIVNSRFVKQ